MKINAEEQKGEQGLKFLIESTREKKKTQYEKAQEEVLKGVFE